MSTAQREFVGDIAAQHLQLPAGSEQCFAAMLTGYVGQGADQIASVNMALIANEVSRPDGATSFFATRTAFDVNGTRIDLDPIATPFNGVEQTDEVIWAINNCHREGRAVALLYDRAWPDQATDFHWLAASGHELVGGAIDSYRLLDPSEQQAQDVRTKVLENMVRRSTETLGVFAYAMSRSGIVRP